MSQQEIHRVLAWFPDWLTAVVILVLTIIVATIVFQLLLAALRAALRTDQKMTRALMQRTGGTAQFAFILLVTSLVVPLVPLDRGATAIFHRFLLAAFVLLLGRVASLASDLAIERYIGRFNLDAEDNLMARKAVTQMRVLRRTANILIGVIAAGFALMTFDTVREYGISLFASAGVAGIAVGFAAKPLLSNFFAGIQLAITQPIHVDDIVVVEGEQGTIEELTATYVVIRLWDLRRLIVPLSYFLEKSFENWTRQSASLLGAAVFHLDYTADIGRIRAKIEEIIKASKFWDGGTLSIQVTEITERGVELRALMSARDSNFSWDLRCEVREKVLAFLQQEYPESLPRFRNDIAEKRS